MVTDFHYHGEIEQEDDGRWIAAVPDVPGVMAYGATILEAKRNAWILLLDVLHDMLSNDAAMAAPESLDLQYN